MTKVPIIWKPVHLFADQINYINYISMKSVIEELIIWELK